MSSERYAYLRESQAALARRLESLNAALTAELRRLRDGIEMAHEVIGQGGGPDEAEVRAMIKDMIESHPGGHAATRLLAAIEDTERRLAAVNGALGQPPDQPRQT